MFRERLEKVAASKVTIVLILLLCLGLRVGMAWYKGDAETPENDAQMYMIVGHHVLEGKGLALGDMDFEAHPTAHVDPIYPAFLAIVFRTVGDNLLDVYDVQAFLDTISCFVLFLMATRFLGPRKLPAVLAALGYALYPPFILSSCTAMTETLSILLCLVAFYVLTIAFGRSVWWFAVAGATMGLTILIRSVMMAFPFAVLALLFLGRHRVGSWVPKAVAYIAMAYLTVLPWTIRNYIVFHAFIPVTTRAGITLWGGTGPADGATLSNWNYPVDSREHRRLFPRHPKTQIVSEATYLRITAFQRRLAGMSEVQRDAALRRAALQEIKRHPAHFAFLGVKKFFRLWFNLWHEFPASQESLAIAALNAVIILMAVLGYLRARADQWLKLITIGTCIYITAVSSVTFAVVRYSYPVMPLVIAFAASWVACLLSPRAARDEGLLVETPVSV